MKNRRKRWHQLLLLVYGILMLWLLFGQRLGQTGEGTWLEQMKSNINLQPFDTVRRYIWVLKNSQSKAMLTTAVVNLAGNVVMFVPLGFLCPGVWEKLRKFGWHLMYMVLTIVGVELIQLVTLLGSLDVDDLILNIGGTTLGFVIWKLTNRKKRK